MGLGRILGSNTTGPYRWSSEPWTVSCGSFHQSERKAHPVRPSREVEARSGPSANMRADLGSPEQGSGNLVGVALPCPSASPVEDFTEAWLFPLLPGTAAHLPHGTKGLLGQGQWLFLGIETPRKSPVLTLFSAVEATFAMVTHIPVASGTGHERVRKGPVKILAGPLTL